MLINIKGFVCLLLGGFLVFFCVALQDFLALLAQSFFSSLASFLGLETTGFGLVSVFKKKNMKMNKMVNIMILLIICCEFYTLVPIIISRQVFLVLFESWNRIKVNSLMDSASKI